jgi:hypothetical protein
MNRDTLYSVAIVDISQGAVVTIPHAGDRYLSVMVVNQDHYINEVLHEPGQHELTVGRFDTPYVCLAARILVDPNAPADVAEVVRLQDGLGLEAASGTPFTHPEYEAASFDATRDELKARITEGLAIDRTFGRRDEVDPDRHRIGTAMGWGGLPDAEAKYISGPLGFPVGEYRLTVRDVPVDGFWSISIYNKDGFFEANDRGVNSINSVTSQQSPDGTVTVNLGGCEDGRPNCVPIMEGWNYTVRLYRPRAEVLDGSYAFPAPERIR